MQWISMFLIAANAYSGQKLCKATFNDIEMLREILPKEILPLKLLTLQLITAFIASSLQFLTSIKNVLAQTKEVPRTKSLKGLMPMVLWLLIRTKSHKCWGAQLKS